MNERNRENFVLDKAKNVGDAVASTRLFNAGQNKICRLQPFNVKQNKSNRCLDVEIKHFISTSIPLDTPKYNHSYRYSDCFLQR